MKDTSTRDSVIALIVTLLQIFYLGFFGSIFALFLFLGLVFALGALSNRKMSIKQEILLVLIFDVLLWVFTSISK